MISQNGVISIMFKPKTLTLKEMSGFMGFLKIPKILVVVDRHSYYTRGYIPPKN